MYYCNGAQTKIRAVLTGRSTVSGFDLACFSSLSSKHLCISGLRGAIYIFIKKILLISFSLLFSDLSLVGLALDLKLVGFFCGQWPTLIILVDHPPQQHTVKFGIFTLIMLSK